MLFTLAIVNKPTSKDIPMSENSKKQGIEAFINPKSVAIIGASEAMAAWGNIIMQNLLRGKFPGKLFAVNNRASTVMGLKTYPDILSIPEKVELAVLAVPAEVIPEMVQACADKGVKGAAIIAAGFGEALPGGREQELDLARMARQKGMRILGPNISGTYNLNNHFNASAAMSDYLIPSPITAICQGSYAIYDLLVDSFHRGMGVGQFVHTGNESDLQVEDFIEYFGQNPQTKVIIMYLETLRDVARFRESTAPVALKKPIIIQKVGATPGGSRAARSHTGSMAGNHTLYQALFRQLNIVVCPTLERLIPLGHGFLSLPPLEGNRIAIITMGGSWGVALTDELEKRGLVVPELRPSLQKRFRQMGLPVQASTRNPIDIGAAASMALTTDVAKKVAEEILKSDEVDGLILHGFGRLALSRDQNEGPKLIREVEKNVMRKFARLAEHHEKPVLVASAVHPSQSPAIHDLIQEGLTIFHQLEEIADILALKYRYQKRSKCLDF